MRVRTKITLCVTTLAAVIFACAALLLWNTDRSTYNHKRSILAFNELAHYLELSSEVVRTFRLVRREMMDGNGKLTFDLDGAASNINMVIDKIDQDTLEEANVGVRRTENQSDVTRANALRREINLAFDDVRRAEQLMAAGRDTDAQILLNRNLGARVDIVINRIIEVALADERTELADALNEIESINEIAVWAAAAATIAGLILTALMIFIFALRLRNSLINLEAGAEIFAAGNLSHEIPVHGYDEFAALSRRLNEMARQLSKQRIELEDARTSLERHVAERTGELMTANAELERRDATRRQFFADIGHELRTPITAARGEAEVALRTRQNHRETYKSALTRIVDISDQLTRFVNDVFLIAREQAGVADMRNDEVDLKEVVMSAITQMHALINRHGVTLTTEMTDDPTRIEGDTQRLCQLVHVLLSNAIQHSPAGVAVEISVRRDGEFCELNVRDNGSGIPDSEIGQVFDRFYRGNSSADNDRIQGTGLGLPIARSIVQAHGGRVWIDPDYHKGTSVLAVFPILDDEPKDGLMPETDTPATRVVA